MTNPVDRLFRYLWQAVITFLSTLLALVLFWFVLL